MNFEFEIKPYVGAGDLCLGMTPEEVQLILGPPDDTEQNVFKEIKESRIENGLNTVYSSTDRRLVEIGFSSNITGLTFKGVSVFSARPLKVFQKFLQEDKEPFETVGFIVLLNIGVTLTGFHNNSPEDRAVTLFEKGRWDSEKPDLKSYKFR